MLRTFSYTIVTAMAFVWVLLLLQFVDFSPGSKPQRVSADFQSIFSALRTYKTVAGGYPSTEQSLMALVERPTASPLPRDWMKISKNVPTDPWQNEYRYRFISNESEPGFELLSSGPDGLPDTEDDRSSLNLDDTES